MKTKLLISLMIMTVSITGCNKQPNNEYDETEKFCSYVSVEDIDQTIPIVNDFLSGLSAGLSDEQQLQSLVTWLKSYRCIVNAALLSQQTDPPTSEIAIWFDENETTKKFIMYVSMERPLKIIGYHEYELPAEDEFCLHLNEEDMGKTIPVVNKFLSGLSNELEDEHQLEELVAWLKTQPCIIDASVLCVETNPPLSKILISFDETGIIKDFIFDVSMNHPLEIVGYREYEPPTENEFCLYLNEGNMVKTIPFVNEFLSELPNELDDDQQLEELVAWLKTQPCIIDASVLCVETNPSMSEILISFDETGIIKDFIFDVSMTQPLEIVGHREYEHPAEDEFCLHLNEEDMSKTIPFVNVFLRELPNGLDNEQQLEELVAWLKTHPCIIDASVLSLETNPSMSKILISFNEAGIIKEFIFDVSMTQPLKIVGFHEYNIYILLQELTSACDCYEEEIPLLGCEDAHLWDYPVTPGMEEWEQLGSYQEKVNACQIPENILSCLTTEELIELTLRNPLFFSVRSHNFIDNGLNQFFNDFNGVRELFIRKDIVCSLTKHYIEVIQQDIFFMKNNGVLYIEKFSFTNPVDCLELLLSRIQLYYKNECLRLILQALVYGYEKKCMYPVYTNLHNYFARAHVINKIRFFPPYITPPDHLPNQSTRDMINELSYQLIK